MSGYSEKQILKDLQDSIQAIDELYQLPMMNYRGVTTDTGVSSSEVIAKYLVQNVQVFDQISSITRSKSYIVPSHNGQTANAYSNRVEERIALSMYNQRYPDIGWVIDYQVPLKNVQTDKAGKIDLLALKHDRLLLLELKKPDSKETLLRCILEAATYHRKIDKTKLPKEWQDKLTKDSKDGSKGSEIPEFNKIVSGLLIFKDGAQHKAYLKSMNETSSVLDLMRLLDVEIYVMEPVNSNTTINKTLYDGNYHIQKL